MKTTAVAFAVLLLTAPAIAQDGGATSTLSPPPAKENSPALAKCNAQADQQELRGVSRDPWIADCLKKELAKSENPQPK